MKSVSNLKIVIYLGLYALLFTPFIVSGSLFFPYITGKAFYFRIITEILFSLWVILALLDKKYRPQKNPILLFLVLFLVSLFFSNILGINPASSFWSNFERMEGYVTLIHLFGLFLIMSSVFKTEKNWFWFFFASIFSSLIMAGTAITQVLEKGLNYRVDTTLGNSTYLGIYMLMHVFLTIWLFSKSKINFKTISFYSLIILLQVFVVFQTGTRGSILGLISGLSLMSLLVFLFSKNNLKSKKVFALILLSVILLLSSLFALKETSLVKNFQGFSRVTNISISEGTAQARLVNWSIAWDGIKERPFLGWGQNNYEFVFNKHFNPKMFGQEAWFDRTHNIIFDWLIAGGLIGLFFYLSIILAALYLTWFKSSFSVIEKSILTGLFSAYFIHNLFVFDNIVSYLLFFFVLAYIASQTSSQINFFSKDFKEGVVYVLISILVISTPLTIYAVNGKALIASQKLIEAIQIVTYTSDNRLIFVHKNGLADNLAFYKEILNKKTFGTFEIRSQLISSASSLLPIEGISPEEKQEFLDFALEEMEREVSKNPHELKPLYLLSSFLINLNKNDAAIEYLNRAIEIAPKRQIFHFLLSRIYLKNGEVKKALEAAKFAYELEPSLYPAWISYVEMLSVMSPDDFKNFINEEISRGKESWVEKMILENYQKNPDKISHSISLAAFYFSINQSEKALEILESARVKFPEAEKQILELEESIQSGENPIGKTF